MGTCASKPKVLNGDAPEVSPENIIANNEDTGVVVKEEVVNKEEIVNNDNVDNTPSLNNALENEEGKGSTNEEAKIEVQVEKMIDDGPKTDATNFAEDEKKIEEVKLEEGIKPSVKSDNKTDDEEKLSKEEKTVEEVIPADKEKTVEEVKPVDTPTTVEDKKIEEKPSAESEKKITEDKPVATKKGKFWWDK